MSDSEDDANLPSAAECQQAIDNFVQITQTDEALAQFYLQVPKALYLPERLLSSVDY